MPHSENAAPGSPVDPPTESMHAPEFDHDIVVFEGSAPDERPPVRIFIGTEDGQWRAERVLLWSIEQVRDPSRTYEIHLMKNFPGFRDARWLTGFTNYRFSIPTLAGGRGRAIYNDVDQIYLRDPALLFDLDMNGAGYLSINDRDTSVMLIDAEQMLPVWPLDQVRTKRRKSLERHARSEPGRWGQLDGGWNARDTEYAPGRSSLVHFTTIHTQPWMPLPKRYTYQHNPVGSLWFDLEHTAEAAAFHVFSEARPTLQYQQLLSAADDGAPGGAVPNLCEAAREERARVLESVGATTVLAYDICGADSPPDPTLAREGRTVTRYDPASRSLDKKPAETFDAVVFTHGIERVPASDLPWLIDSLFQLARQIVYVSLDAEAPNPNGNRKGSARDRFFWSELIADAGARHPEIDWRLVAHRASGETQELAWQRGRAREPGAPPRTWVLEDGETRHTNQSLALAEAIGLGCERVHVASSSSGEPSAGRAANRRLPTSLAGVDRAASGALEPPWPDLVIATGETVAPVAKWIAEESSGHTRVALIGREAAAFADDIDLAVSCLHSRLLPHRRRLETLAPINRISDETLSAATASAESGSVRPIVILVGDASPQYVLDRAAAQQLGEDVVAFAAGRRVLAITSRSTADAAVEGLAAGLSNAGTVHADGDTLESNAVCSALATAAAVVVTGDSELMLGEAVSSGAPVYIYPTARKRPAAAERFAEWVRDRAYARPKKRAKGSVRPQTGPERFFSLVLAGGFVPVNPDLAAFHANLVASGTARMWGEPLDLTRNEPLREAARVAAHVRKLLSLPAAPEGKTTTDGPDAPPEPGNA